MSFLQTPFNLLTFCPVTPKMRAGFKRVCPDSELHPRGSITGEANQTKITVVKLGLYVLNCRKSAEENMEKKKKKRKL